MPKSSGVFFHVFMFFMFSCSHVFFHVFMFFSGGAVASWLLRSTPEQLSGSSPRLAVFLGKTLHFHSASLHPGV